MAEMGFSEHVVMTVLAGCANAGYISLKRAQRMVSLKPLSLKPAQTIITFSMFWLTSPEIDIFSRSRRMFFFT